MEKCLSGAIELKENRALILDSCTSCGVCIPLCKSGAIEYNSDEAEVLSNDIVGYKGVWVVCECKNGTVDEVTLELLGAGRQLANSLGVKLSAVILGKDISDAANMLIKYSADNVYAVEHPSLMYFNDEIYTDILAQLVQRYKPEIILIGATVYGKSLAPSVASRLNTGLTADCTSLEIDPERKILLQVRPAFGGNIIATVICPGRRPQMATVRPRAMKAQELDENRKGRIIRPDVKIPGRVSVNVINSITDSFETVNLKEADIIVSAGMGIGSPQNLELIKELANVLGGAVGASRSIVDAGWIDYSHQIGQTGKTVRPKIYFACGISGAVQHIAGISSSETIIAINKDLHAPIFNIAKYGIVGDVLEVLPALINELKTRS